MNSGAYLAAPPGNARGAIVVIQEIFGVNGHIRAVTEGFAAEGYVAIAPSLFDRVRRGVELGYDEKSVQVGFGYVKQLKHEEILKDLSAAIAVVKHAGRVGVVGYCWGGTMAYVAACELPVSCAVAYYGGSIVKYLDKKPKRPVMYHFGELDDHITPPTSQKSARRTPKASIICIRARGTASTATSAAATSPRAPPSPGNAPWNFSRAA